MQIIGNKREIERLSPELLEEAPSLDEKTLTLKIKRIVVAKKVRSPAVEHFSVLLYNAVSVKHQLGGNVILGRILQLRLEGRLATTHYTVKKGFSKNYSEQSFPILLSCASVGPSIKKGIGWAARIVARFHPDIMSKSENHIESDPDIKQWFNAKINVGPNRSFKYASRYPG